VAAVALITVAVTTELFSLATPVAVITILAGAPSTAAVKKAYCRI
jgi:hypothetical protein